MADKREQCKSCKMGCMDSIYKIKLNTARIPFDKCLDYTPKQTNADKIRSMSDEELAEFIIKVRDCCSTNYCEGCLFGKNGCSKGEICDWLQSEAE